MGSRRSRLYGTALDGWKIDRGEPVRNFVCEAYHEA